MQRVQKLISNRGYCSRRKAEELIKAGRVKVNGKTVSIGDQAENKDEISVDDEAIDRPRKIYLLFNKPLGCITAMIDSNHKTVMEYIPLLERVFPVGRLDHNTSGMLLLTNDGDFANRVMHPRNEVKKTYEVKLDSWINDEQIKQVREGILLRDGKTSPAIVKKLDRKFLEVVIHEGKNQIIKRMFRKLGFTVISLKRVRIGRLGLGKLKLGEYRELTPEDIKKIFPLKKRK